MKKQDWCVLSPGCYVVDAGGWTVAQFNTYDDAQLCAAAPFMRETLERIISIMEAKAYTSEADIINLAKDALAACEVRKEQI